MCVLFILSVVPRIGFVILSLIPFPVCLVFLPFSFFLYLFSSDVMMVVVVAVIVIVVGVVVVVVVVAVD